MKKAKSILSALAITSIIIAGCSANKEQEAEQTSKESSQQVETTQEKTNTQTTDKKQTVSPEQIEKSTKKLVQEAQKNNILKESDVKVEKDTVTANIQFNDKISNEEKSQFLFNYQVLLQMQYPDQKVQIKIDDKK